MRLSSVVVVVAIVLLSGVGCRASENKSVSPSPAPSASAAAAVVADASVEADAGSAAVVVAALPHIETDWCLPPFRGLDEATCYWLPESFEAGKELRLLIYLSGIVPPTPKVSPQKENVQRIVSSAAKKANAAVLLPRGRRGIGPADAKDWWAWPTSASDYGVHAKAIVSEWKAARAKLEEAALGGSRRFDRVYLAGSSSGAYFLSALALAGALTDDAIHIDGFAATSGGSPGMLGASGTPATAPKRPFYVGYATGDPTNGGPKSLASFLSAKGWPVRMKEHAGGHGAREEYLDDAFQFWAESPK